MLSSDDHDFMTGNFWNVAISDPICPICPVYISFLSYACYPTIPYPIYPILSYVILSLTALSGTALPFIYAIYVNPIIYLSIYLSVCLSIYLASYLSIYRSIHPSIYLSSHLLYSHTCINISGFLFLILHLPPLRFTFFQPFSIRHRCIKLLHSNRHCVV